MPSQAKIQLTDEQLAEFTAFYEADRNALIGLLIRLRASKAEAQDVVQETMLTALKDWPAVVNPKAYVRAVATRMLYRTWERDERDSLGLERIAQDKVWTAFDANEDTDRALEMLASLPWNQRLVFSLHVDGYEHAEIAEITGQHLSTVRSNLRHAREKLIRKLDAESIRKEATHGP